MKKPSMHGIDHLLERAKTKRARDQRLEAARAAFMKLAPDEREELLIALLAELDSVEKPEGAPPAAPPPEAAPQPLLSTAYNAGARDAAETFGIKEARPPGYGVKEAIVDAMRDGHARAAGEIAKATKELHPWVNVGSIPAAIQRMASEMDPPLLIKRGKNDRGHPLYIIAPAADGGE